MAGTIPVLAQCAASEAPRWTRALGIIPATHYKVRIRTALSGEGPSSGEEAVLADSGREGEVAAEVGAGEKLGPFEHPAGESFHCAKDMRINEILAC